MALSRKSPLLRSAVQFLRGVFLRQGATSYCTATISERVNVNGINLHYQRTGWGDHAVLLLPGVLGSGQTDFGPQLKSLDKEAFTIIAWDPRGYGYSVPPSRDYPLHFFERDAKDAVDLMQALNFKKFSLLGWSDGGVTALIGAGTYPSLIRKLVVWGANASVTEEDLKLYNAIKDVSNWSEKMRKPMEDLYGKEYFADTFKAWCEAMCKLASRTDGNICRHLLPLINCPTLIIHGEKDPMVPSFHPQYIHQQIKGSRILLLNNRKEELAFFGAANVGSGQTDFGPQLKSLDKEAFTIIAWDPRGYGYSVPPSRDYPLHFFERDAKDAVDLMQALNFKKFSLLGWSDGGVTALIGAGTYPSLIRKLVVWGANASVTEEDLKLYNAIKDVSNWSEKMRKPMEDLYGKEYFADTFKAWCEAMCKLASRTDGNICRHLLPLINCPTLIIHGEKDPMVPSFHPQYIHQQIKGSRLHLMSEGKHNLHLRYAEEFNGLVEDFLCEK